MRIPIYFQRETRDPLHVTGCMHLVGEILERSVVRCHPRDARSKKLQKEARTCL